MNIPLFQVDAFTDRPFAGNPAAVCILDRVVTDQWMQDVAAEMNLAETAFLTPDGSQYNLRWFTPVTEVDLCGHATLASAHILWETNKVQPNDEIVFQTRSGLLKASKSEGSIRLDFPTVPATSCSPPNGLLEALGMTAPLFVGKNLWDYFIEIESEASLKSLTPDFRKLSQIDSRGVIVTSSCTDDEFDFLSRYFAPAAGIDEDPVTGSAHCCLGHYWSERLTTNQLKARQASARGGVVDVQVNGDRTCIGGQTVTVFRGELIV